MKRLIATLILILFCVLLGNIITGCRTNEKINAANELVKRLAQEKGAGYIDINAPLKDANGCLKAEYTIEGMHIKEEGYRAIYPEFMKYATEPAWK